MLWLNIGVLFLIAFLVSLYFLPYRKLKDKIFKKLFYKTELIDALFYENGRQRLRFKRRGDTWIMTEPELWAADATKMRKLLLRITDIQVEDRITRGDPDSSDYDIGKNGRLMLSFDGSEAFLTMGARSPKNEELIYVTKSGEKDILLIAASFLTVLPKDIDDFKNMLIFDGYYSQIRSLDIGKEDRVFNLIRADGSWISRGQNMFDDKVQPVLTALLETEATGFVDSNMRLPAKPYAVITLKTTKHTATRHFFLNETNPATYYMPLDGKILTVRKSDIDRVLSI